MYETMINSTSSSNVLWLRVEGYCELSSVQVSLMVTFTSQFTGGRLRTGVQGVTGELLCKNQSVRRHFGLSRFVCTCVVHDISSSMRCRATIDDAIDDAPFSRRLDAGLKMFCEHCGQRCLCPTCHAKVSSCGCSKWRKPRRSRCERHRSSSVHKQLPNSGGIASAICATSSEDTNCGLSSS